MMGNKNNIVHITKAVEEDLSEFDSNRSKVIQEILTLERNPYAGHALRGKLRGLRSLEFTLHGGACRAI